MVRADLDPQRPLDGLRAQAARDPRAATRQAAVQLESQFLQMVVKSMRDATPRSEAAPPGADSFTAMLDAQFAGKLAGQPGGLADLIEKQLSMQMRQMPATPAPAATPALPAAASNAAPVAAAAPAPTAAPAGSRQSQFLQRMLPHAQAAERATGVPAAFILGQAALESGWGRGEIRHADGRPSHNLFGIKATAAWRGDAATARTTEYEGGQPTRLSARFRSYGSYAEAFTDFARLLAGSPRYAGALRTAVADGSPQAYATEMQRAGYATDPRYASKLARTIGHAMALQQQQLQPPPALA